MMGEFCLIAGLLTVAGLVTIGVVCWILEKEAMDEDKRRRTDLAPALPSADYVAGLGWPAKDGCKGECEYAPTLRAMKREIDQMAVAKLSGQDIKDAICDALGDAMDCTRVWVAWSYGTMSQDDFELVRDDADRVEEIVAAINNALAARAAPQPAADTRVVGKEQLALWWDALVHMDTRGKLDAEISASLQAQMLEIIGDTGK